MEAPLCLIAVDNATLLQEVPVNVRACNAPIGGKHNADELAKPTGIVVPLCLGITESF